MDGWVGLPEGGGRKRGGRCWYGLEQGWVDGRVGRRRRRWVREFLLSVFKWVGAWVGGWVEEVV